MPLIPKSPAIMITANISYQGMLQPRRSLTSVHNENLDEHAVHLSVLWHCSDMKQEWIEQHDSPSRWLWLFHIVRVALLYRAQAIDQPYAVCKFRLPSFEGCFLVAVPDYAVRNEWRSGNSLALL